MKAIHPGEHLAEELREMGMSAAELSRQLKVPTNRVTQILNGRRSITGDTALRLAHFFGTSAEFWLNLQSLYEIRLAQKKSGAAIKALPTINDPYPTTSGPLHLNPLKQSHRSRWAWYRVTFPSATAAT
jgi:addiction module HigA family antidote